MDIITLTLVHTGLSFIALGLGIAAMVAMFNPSMPRVILNTFVVLAWVTTLTGFLFPLNGFTPALGTGIVSVFVLGAVAMAQSANLRGRWRRIYAIGIVVSVYLLVFVTIAQAFLKLPPLTALAPTGSEPPFAVAQLLNLALFGWLGYKATKVFVAAAPASKPRKR